MTKDEAVKILATVLSQVRCTLPEHEKIQEAFRLLLAGG